MEILRVETSPFFYFLIIISQFLTLVIHPSVNSPVDVLEPCTKWRYLPHNSLFLKFRLLKSIYWVGWDLNPVPSGDITRDLPIFLIAFIVWLKIFLKLRILVFQSFQWNWRKSLSSGVSKFYVYDFDL